jgi:hypothetical protein
LAVTSTRRDSNESKRGNNIAGGAGSVSVSWKLGVLDVAQLAQDPAYFA